MLQTSGESWRKVERISWTIQFYFTLLAKDLDCLLYFVLSKLEIGQNKTEDRQKQAGLTGMGKNNKKETHNLLRTGVLL